MSIVQFTNLSGSVNGITSSLWDFGDGTTSTEENPSHEFGELYYAKTYTVTLTVTGPDGTASSTQYITIEAANLKYDLGAPNNEVWATDSHGKKWICNGNKTVKIEGSNIYQVGISAPIGATTLASAGAGLPDGEYSIYAGYGRVVGGNNVLYGKGEFVGTVTLGAGNNQISVSIPNSADPQVNNKIVWIKSPNEAIHYFYYQTYGAESDTIIISSDSQKNNTIVYEFDAADNGEPPAITFIFAFAGRLWGIIDNIIYFSDQGGFSEFDLEIWRASNYRITPYKLTGIFSVGQNLYFNTENGIVLLPNGDINQQLYLIESRWHFEYMRTVAPWNNGVIGVTNDGVRMFDGEQFTPYDLAYPIRSKLVRIYDSPSNFKPCGYVYRRSSRDEYHLMWQDQTLSVNTNNTHAVLNLSSVSWMDSLNYNLAWEFQPISGNYAAVDSRNSVYIAQSHESSSIIYRENEGSVNIADVYNKLGVFISGSNTQEVILQTREYIYDLAAIMWLKKFYIFAQNEYSFTIQFFSGNDVNKFSQEFTVAPSPTGGAAFDSAVWDVSQFASDSPVTTRVKMPTDFKCKSLYAIIKQNANDVNFKIMALNIYVETEVNNYT